MMLRKLRILLNIVLCRIGIRDILPAEAIRRVHVIENNDPMIDISADKLFFFYTNLHSPIYVRNEVYYRLRRAANHLPKGVFLKIYDAHRSLENQRESWRLAFQKTSQEKRNLPLAEVRRLTRLKVAEADLSSGEYGGHQTGGAVDVTLCDGNGRELMMGTMVAEYNIKTKTKNPFVSKEEKQNRVTLYEAMNFAGFRNFSAEWWHFSYGDRLWAAYSGFKKCRYGLASASDTLLRRGRISDGLNDITRYIGLDPEHVVCIHSVGCPEDKKELNPPPLRHAQMLSYLPRKKKGAHALALYICPELVTYFDAEKIALNECISILGAKPETATYPDISVAAQFCKAIECGEKNIIQVLKGKMLISSYPGVGEEKLTELANMRLLMEPQQQLQFNSKARLRRNAVRYKYNVLPGVEISSIEEFDEKISELRRIGIRAGVVDIEKVKFWCKCDAQSDGKGSISFQGLHREVLDSVKRHIDDLDTKLFPLVIELDAGSLPYSEVVMNMGVEAVVSKDGVTLVGPVAQDTFHGRYIGSSVIPEREQCEAVADATAIPVFISMQQEGYRGPVTVDVLVVRNKKNSTYVGYNIDPNARFSAGMQLLSLIHHTEELSGEQRYGISRFNTIRDSSSLFEDVRKYTSPYLYQGARSCYEGIIPLVINDITKTKDNKRVIQVAVIARDFDRAKMMYQSFKDKIVSSTEN